MAPEAEIRSPGPGKPGGTLAALLVLFFVSGACSLVYQLIWARMLVVVFGVGTWAVSTVLAAFMAGLALGSFGFGRLADRRGDPLRIYGLLELGIAAAALLIPAGIAGLEGVCAALSRVAGDAGFAAARFALTFALLLVPTTLMGATLPVLSRFAVTRASEAGQGVGRLYAANTFGAAAGCLLTAFALLPHTGTWGATAAAAAGNALAGIAAILLNRVCRGRPEASVTAIPAGAGRPEPPGREPLPGWVGPAVLAAIAVSGFAALGYEVVWTRLLSILNRTTTAQSLSVILIAFLLGLASGGAAGARLSVRLRDAVLALGAAQLLIGLFGLLSTALLGGVPAYFEILGNLFGIPPLAQLFLAALVVTIVPTCLMGAAFPIAGRLNVRRLDRVGRSVGDLYAANTAGAIAGALAAGFLLVPWLGTQGSVEALAWCNIAAGTALAALSPQSRPAGRLRALVLAGAAAAALHLAIPGDLFVRLLSGLEAKGRLLYYSESTAGTVTVHETGGGQRSLRVNGTGEVRSDFASIQTFRMLGNLAPLLHPDPRQVAVVAFGGGVTLSSVELHRPEHLACAEVVPGVFGAAPLFAEYNNRIADRFGAGYLRLIAEDGRNHLLRTGNRYDVIICDSTHPTTADSWLLYTREFYRLCRQRLEPGGMVAQWVPSHGLSVEEYRTIVRTFSQVFPHTSLWINQVYTILLATPGPLVVDMKDLAGKLARPAIAANLGKVELADPVAFLGTIGLDERGVARYAGEGNVNTDRRTRAGYRQQGER
ncbi:MAG: fused MFS/spermidine synthase, partial [Gemmatimonadetes bacterium]|nr:fused MFS/spermidine synthase [Gemmatimonadota bacterium]